jgi:hypothetical protein
VEQLWQQIKQRFLSNTTFQNYDDIIERSCQAWNEILSEDGFIKNLCQARLHLSRHATLNFMGHDNLSMFKNLLKYRHESKKQACNLIL